MTYIYNNTKVQIDPYQAYLCEESEEMDTFFAITVDDEKLVGMYITQAEAMQAAEDFIDEELPYL